MSMTLEEFEQQNAERRGVPLEQLRQFGYYAIPCICDEPGCEGWQMVRRDRRLLDYLEKGIPIRVVDLAEALHVYPRAGRTLAEVIEEVAEFEVRLWIDGGEICYRRRDWETL